MPARPNDPREFEDALNRASDALEAGGHAALAARVARAADDMGTAGYKGGPPGVEARQRVRSLLEEIGKESLVVAARDEINYAMGWLRRVDDFHRELAAKGHFDRRPARDINEH